MYDNSRVQGHHQRIRGTWFSLLVISIQVLMVYKSWQVGQMMTDCGISYHERQPVPDPGQ